MYIIAGQIERRCDERHVSVELHTRLMYRSLFTDLDFHEFFSDRSGPISNQISPEPDWIFDHHAAMKRASSPAQREPRRLCWNANLVLQSTGDAPLRRLWFVGGERPSTMSRQGPVMRDHQVKGSRGWWSRRLIQAGTGGVLVHLHQL